MHHLIVSALKEKKYALHTLIVKAPPDVDCVVGE